MPSSERPHPHQKQDSKFLGPPVDPGGLCCYCCHALRTGNVPYPRGCDLPLGIILLSWGYDLAHRSFTQRSCVQRKSDDDLPYPHRNCAYIPFRCRVCLPVYVPWRCYSLCTCRIFCPAWFCKMG